MYADQPKKRVALLGLMLESNSFAPVTGKDDFLDRLYVAGDEFSAELTAAESKLPTELRSFNSAMNASANWQPVPILIGLVEAGGPIDHAFFEETISDMRSASRPRCADAVYICNDGAMITTENRDPDGEIFSMVREIVGPDVPSSPHSIFTAMSRAAWWKRSMPSSPIAPTRTSTWPSAAARLQRPSTRCLMA